MSKKILLIEDNADIRGIYKRFLEEDGFEVVTEGDGILAKDMLIKGGWDLVLLDIMLPKLDGLSLLKEYYKNSSVSQVPIIVISNVNEQKFIKQCLDLGVREYIVKAETLPSQIVEKVKEYTNAEKLKNNI